MERDLSKRKEDSGTESLEKNGSSKKNNLRELESD